MIWSCVVKDVISFPNHPYKYEVTEIRKNWAVLKNCLTHKYREVRISVIKKDCKIESRHD